MVGCIYALIALGFNIIYSASGLMSFVQGEIFMLGAFIAFTLTVTLHLPFLMGALLTLVIMFGFGFLMERTMIGPILRKGGGSIHIVLATIGLSIFLQNFAMLVWGTTMFNFPSPLGDDSIMIGNVYVTPQYILIMVVTLICMVLLYLLMQRTKLGTSLRAATQDPMAASVMGINVPFTVRLTWALAAVLCAVAGVLLAPVYGVFSRMGANVATKGFAAAVVGGYGNMYGSIIGGVILGVVETLVAGYFDSAYKDVISFVVLIIVLITMPTGILRSKAD